MTKGARLRAVVVRTAKPYWTHLPASGDGAAKHGGRFNPIGIPALYTSFSFNTAAKEVRFSLNADPYTFYFFQVDSDRVVDLSDANVRKALKVDWSELDSPNWESDTHKGIEPASHKLARRLIHAGYAGIIVPSFARGATQEWHAVHTSPKKSCAINYTPIGGPDIGSIWLPDRSRPPFGLLHHPPSATATD